MDKEREQKYTVIEEWFYPAPVYDANGFIVPAPPEALQKYDEVNGDWLPKYAGAGSPCVSLFPVISLEKEGYMVQSSVYKRE